MTEWVMLAAAWTACHLCPQAWEEDAIPAAWPESPTIRHMFLMEPSRRGPPVCHLHFPLRANPETMAHRHAAIEQTTRMHFSDWGSLLNPVY